MTRKIQFFIAALLVVMGTNVWAQTAQDSVYVFLDDQPNALRFLPEPPDSGSLEYIDDLVQYQWGKSLRNTERGRQANRESQWQANAMRVMMAEVLGLDTISDTTTPALARLLVKTYNTGSQAVTQAKEHWRTRPFLQMNDPLWGKYEKDDLGTNSSYPSGHAAFGWATALVFAEMWPELQDAILSRGMQFGMSRVIVGAHYQSDVTAGFLTGAASVARAHSNPELEKDIYLARAEYARLKKLPAGYNPIAKAELPHGEDFLNPAVDTTSYRYISDITRYWSAKPLRYTERGKQAASEAEYSVEMMYKVFGEAMGVNIRPEGTPAICALIDYVLTRSSECADRLKELRFRKRPFVQLGEPSFVPGDEEKERGKSSFPSGHTNLGWTEALTLAEVAPDRQDEILRRGYEYGHNRLIVGYHWFTDIEATRQLSSALVARLHTDDTYCRLLQDAKAEYYIRTHIVAPKAPALEQQSATIYTLDGRVADANEHGILIQDGKKRLAK